MGDDVAVLIECDLLIEELGVGNMSDGKEKSAAVNGLNLIGFYVSQLDIREFLISDSLFKNVEWENFDFWVILDSGEHDLGGSEFITSVNKDYLTCELREVRGFFHGTISSSNNNQNLISENWECSITDGTS